jgi:uncharacterized protein YbjT (DUF2867 family)
MSMSKILVTGGNGTLGQAVVARLLTRYYTVRLFNHHASSSVSPDVEVCVGDLAQGTGLSTAVAGMDAIIHCCAGYLGYPFE